MRGVEAIVGKRAETDLGGWLNDFYRQHAEFTAEQVRPAMTALAEAVGSEAMREVGREWEWNEDIERWLADYVETFGRRYSGCKSPS